MADITTDLYEFTDESQYSRLTQLVSDIDANTDVALTDVDPTDPQTDVNQSLPADSDDLAAREVELVRPTFNPEQANTTVEETVFRNGQQYTIRVRKPAKCPTCGYVPKYTAEKYIEMAKVTNESGGKQELPELKGICSLCREYGDTVKQTCTNCQRKCTYCGELLCHECSYGYPTADRELCWPCYRNVVELEENETAFRLLEHHLEERATLLQHETIREAEFRRQELEDRKHRRTTRLQETQMEQQRRIQEVQAWVQHQDNLARQDLEQLQFQLESEMRERQQLLKEWQAVANYQLEQDYKQIEKELEKQRLDIEHEKVGVQREKHRLDHEHRQDRLDFEKDRFKTEHSWEKEKFNKEHEWEKEQFREEMDFNRARWQDEYQLKKESQRFDQRKKAVDTALTQEKHDLELLKGTVTTLQQLGREDSFARQKVEENVLQGLNQLSGMGQPRVAAELDL